ncbi:transglutaminase domain-containing protein [Halobacterium wangiae]|uniref:transglutaminase domain-containing protein n=1 Tax=Halobacterium wangiae TaxID=2902623 RepID=UPI001E58195C|nr:transglutaminase domain-containing protein [Halobacterium wangiae]
MSDDAASDGPDSRRALLAVVAVLGLVAASTAAPVLAGQTPLGGLDSPQAPSDAPEFLRQFDGLRDAFEQNQAELDVEGSSGVFGALSLGDSTSVGGPISQSQRTQAATPHFVAETDEPQYWRTGAYVAYTGSGWERDSVNRIEASPSVERRSESRHTVTLRQAATALPSPWRPFDLEYTCTGAESCGQEFSQTDTGGVRARPGLDAGEEYSVETLDPVSDESDLRDIRVRGSIASTKYTTVETTDRVEQLSERLVGDADNRYEAARTVETYLENEKNYSLSDVPEPGDQIADQFLFEQEQGYCEYYATAMVVMLRSQDVPARYVAGYAPGERVGEDRYLVRGADAHAWVEVYFEQLGWVRFDPTPSAPRQAADERLGENSPSFRVQLNQSAIPGETVTASVTTAGVPAYNVAVSVNGDRVGYTDADGEVTFTVPYAETLEVTVEPRENDTTEPSGAESGSSYAGGLGTAAFAQQDDGDGSNGTTQEFDVNTNVRFQFDGEVEPGAERSLLVTLGGKQFENATVGVAGVQQGQTDADGRVTVEIPDDASGVVELTVSRGDLTKTRTYPVEDLSVAVSPSLVAPFPTTTATAHVTSGGEAVSDVPVQLNGETIGTTDAEGRVQFEIPLSRVPAVTASVGGDRAKTYVDGVLPTLAVAVLAVLAALGGVVVAARRTGVSLDSVLDALVRVVGEAVSAMVGALVSVVDAVEELTAEFRDAAEDGWRGVLAWLASLPGRLTVPDVGAWLAGVVAAARSRPDEEGRANGTNGADGDRAAAGHLQSVWRRFVTLVGVERWQTKTPGEVARRAVRAGFPRGPVYALTNAFRDAAYGGRSAESRLDRARSALASLRDDEEEGEQ